MSLHVDTQGSGPPLVMLHGWGMHGGVWGEAAATLARGFTVHCVDLPGHGLSAGSLRAGEPFALDSVVDALAARFEEPIHLLGWSLGGMIAQRWAARQPQKIKRLVLVASTPCFAARPGWPFGMPAEILGQFAQELEQNFAATLRRFLALQVRGGEGERELLAALRERLFSRGEPDMDALRGGLAILRDADLRPGLAHLLPPTLAIAGQRDKLTPAQASHYFAQAMADARAVEIAGAAHAPFLSHPDIFIGHVKSFLHE